MNASRKWFPQKSIIQPTNAFLKWFMDYLLQLERTITVSEWMESCEFCPSHQSLCAASWRRWNLQCGHDVWKRACFFLQLMPFCQKPKEWLWSFCQSFTLRSKKGAHYLLHVCWLGRAGQRRKSPVVLAARLEGWRRLSSLQILLRGRQYQWWCVSEALANASARVKKLGANEAWSNSWQAAWQCRVIGHGRWCLMGNTSFAISYCMSRSTNLSEQHTCFSLHLYFCLDVRSFEMFPTATLHIDHLSAAIMPL